MGSTHTPDQVSPFGLALPTGAAVRAGGDEEVVVVEVVLAGSQTKKEEPVHPRPGALLRGAWADSETEDGAEQDVPTPTDNGAKAGAVDRSDFLSLQRSS